MFERWKIMLGAKFPLLISLKKNIFYRRYKNMTMEDIFADFYYKHGWAGQQSVSGTGSDLRETNIIRVEIPILIKEMGIRSMLDAPCGDLHWLKETDLGVDKYIGADIVPEVISINKEQYETDWQTFVVLDITDDKLPEVDLILCRDCLIHFSYRHIFLALENIKRSKSKFILTTTHTNVRENIDIITGSWRPINLQRPPLNFPKPLVLVSEQTSSGQRNYTGKSLGLWMVKDIPV